MQDMSFREPSLASNTFRIVRAAIILLYQIEGVRSFLNSDIAAGVKRAVKIIRKSQLAISTGAVEDEACHSLWEPRNSILSPKPPKTRAST